MLEKLHQVARQGSITMTHAYLGHIKREEDRKVLANAVAVLWADLEPPISALLEQYLYQAIEGELNEANFPAFYTGEVLSVAKVASPEFDHTRNRPTVEILEAIRGLPADQTEQLINLGNTLAYKVMAAGAIKNHLVAVLKFEIVPVMGAQPVRFVFATICGLEDREEALLDEHTGRFAMTALTGILKRGNLKLGCFFPCLDEDGKESADLMVYASGAAAPWFKALESGLKLSPAREGKALIRMIAAENVDGEVPHDLFRKMGTSLLDEAKTGLNVETVADSMERAVGHGIDRLGFKARWELAFGDLGYKPAYDSLFGSETQEKPTMLKMQAGDIGIKLAPMALERFRQVTVGDQTFIAFAVDQRAKVVVGKDLDLKIRPVEPEDLYRWFASGE